MTFKYTNNTQFYMLKFMNDTKKAREKKLK